MMNLQDFFGAIEAAKENYEAALHQATRAYHEAIETANASFFGNPVQTFEDVDTDPSDGWEQF